MKKVIPALVAGFVCAGPAFSCPWAGGIYSAQAAEVTIKFSVNADCTSTTLLNEYSKEVNEKAPLIAGKREWKAQFPSGGKLRLDAKGRRANVSRGGLKRRLSVKRLN